MDTSGTAGKIVVGVDGSKQSRQGRSGSRPRAALVE